MGSLPAVVPARMVNEFAYCPRLFHLEWVGREWADNADTAEEITSTDVSTKLGATSPPVGCRSPQHR